MEFRELTIKKREGTGKEVARRPRRRGLVPAVLYGGGAPQTLTVGYRDVIKVIQGREGSTTLLTLKFEDGGGSARTAIIRDMQFDPVSEKVIHVDLEEVRMDRAITVGVPVFATGEAEGVKEQAGILETILREVQVSCLPGLIPERITVDVSALMIGDVLTVANLAPPEGGGRGGGPRGAGGAALSHQPRLIHERDRPCRRAPLPAPRPRPRRPHPGVRRHRPAARQGPRPDEGGPRRPQGRALDHRDPRH